MVTITISKKIPKTSTIGGYSDIDGGGSGDTTDPVSITLNGAQQISGSSKKKLIKIKVKQSPNTQNTTPSDDINTKIVDLKELEETIKVRGWLEDDSTETAWSKYWKLRAMMARGGALYTLVIDNVTFGSTTWEVYLEEVAWIVDPTNGSTLNTSEIGFGDSARITIDLAFYMGNSR